MAVAFDPLAHDEPYAAYRALRESWPVYRNEARGFWALSRFEDVQRAAREWTGFSSAEGVNLDDTLSLTGAGNFISADPPDHDRLRRVVRGRFTPPAVAAMQAAIRDDVRKTSVCCADGCARSSTARSRAIGCPRRGAPPAASCARI